jgi:hypothetical protein
MIDGTASTSALAGSIAAKKISVNTTLGFSIVEFEGNATSGATIAHGLGGDADMVIVKSTNLGQAWNVYIKDVTDTDSKYLRLNTTDTIATLSTSNYRFIVNNFSSTVFSVGSDNATNGNGDDYIAYCFKSTTGFSKVGSYPGNGNSNGPMIETGFEPAYIVVKEAVGTTNDWYIYDKLRDSTNPRDKVLTITGDAQSTNTSMSMNWYTNGFQPIDTGGGMNRSGSTYVYLAMAADPSTTTPTLADSFGVDLYTGNGGTQIINSVGFKPDLVWVKSRKNTAWYSVIDSIRGGSKRIVSNSSNAQTDYAQRITSFDTGGFTVGSDGDLNGNNYNLVAWCWKAGGGTLSINTDGTIDSIVSANQAAGFSIVSFTSTGAASVVSTGHGLSAEPELVIFKNLDATSYWLTYHKDIGDNGYLSLDDTFAIQPFTPFFDITSTTIGVRQSSLATGTTEKCIAYCWYSVANYSKIGSFSGNRPSTVTVTTGFEPTWVMIKDTTNNGEGWAIIDNKRVDELLEAQSSSAETSYNSVQFTSTGFTVGDSGLVNTSGATIIYIAIKEN